MNQGETRTALASADSYIPGWDFAGIVTKAAVDGSTPKEGTRVFGFVSRGSWAEYLVAPGWLMAEIPKEISSVQAAALPIAGATALTALEMAGPLSGRRVLVTGAAGGVGRFACQLAALGDARVFAISLRPELLRQLQDDRVEPAGVFTTINEAKALGEYDVILDSIGGETLAMALAALARDGICINFGNSSRQPTTFDVRAGTWPYHSIKCIWMGRGTLTSNCTPLLNHLADLVKQGHLHVPIDTELPWTSIVEAAERLIEQRVNGKIILKVME
ncbi:zinc-binding dehydrogenase [Flavitalea flava]